MQAGGGGDGPGDEERRLAVAALAVGVDDAVAVVVEAVAGLDLVGARLLAAVAGGHARPRHLSVPVPAHGSPMWKPSSTWPVAVVVDAVADLGEGADRALARAEHPGVAGPGARLARADVAAAGRHRALDAGGAAAGAAGCRRWWGRRRCRGPGGTSARRTRGSTPGRRGRAPHISERSSWPGQEIGEPPAVSRSGSRKARILGDSARAGTRARALLPSGCRGPRRSGQLAPHLAEASPIGEATARICSRMARRWLPSWVMGPRGRVHVDGGALEPPQERGVVGVALGVVDVVLEGWQRLRGRAVGDAALAGDERSRPVDVAPVAGVGGQVLARWEPPVEVVGVQVDGVEARVAWRYRSGR